MKSQSSINDKITSIKLNETEHQTAQAFSPSSSDKNDFDNSENEDDDEGKDENDELTNRDSRLNTDFSTSPPLVTEMNNRQRLYQVESATNDTFNVNFSHLLFIYRLE
jgi:hypothetical protein